MFDVVFCGEGDLTVPRFCDDYCRSGSNPADLSALDLTLYPGIYLYTRGECKAGKDWPGDSNTGRDIPARAPGDRDISGREKADSDLAGLDRPGREYPGRSKADKDRVTRDEGGREKTDEHKKGLDNGETVISTPPVHQPLEVIERLPLPDRSVFDHRRYQEFWEHTLGCRMTSIMVTRGCPYSCDFCSKPVWGNDYRKPSLERVFAEIRDILSYGYDRLWIADDSFTLDTKYLEEFCNRKISEGFPFTWTCLSRVDRLDEEIVGLMKDAGCVRVHLGLESGNDETLRLMGKRISVRDGMEAVRLFRQAGIETAGFFIVGYPGETEESIDETLGTGSLAPPRRDLHQCPLPASRLPFVLPCCGRRHYGRMEDCERDLVYLRVGV